RAGEGAGGGAGGAGVVGNGAGAAARGDLVGGDLRRVRRPGEHVRRVGELPESDVVPLDQAIPVQHGCVSEPGHDKPQADHAVAVGGLCGPFGVGTAVFAEAGSPPSPAGRMLSSAAMSKPHASSVAAWVAGVYSASTPSSANSPDAPKSWPGTGGPWFLAMSRHAMMPSPAAHARIRPPLPITSSILSTRARWSRPTRPSR